MLEASFWGKSRALVIVDVKSRAATAQRSSKSLTGLWDEVRLSRTLPWYVECAINRACCTLRNVLMRLLLPSTGMQTLVHSEDYLSVTVPLLEAEHTAGGWDADELLQAVLAYPDDFYHGSHTLIHLSRDELQESDCNIEDGGQYTWGSR